MASKKSLVQKSMRFTEFNKNITFWIPWYLKLLQICYSNKAVTHHTSSVLLAHERHHLPGQDIMFYARFLPQKVSNPLIKVHSELSLPHVRLNLLHAIAWTIKLHVHHHIQTLFKEINPWKIELTGLSRRVFDEKGRYVLVHSHLIFSNAGVGTSVFIPNTTDMKFTSICCKRHTHKQCSFLTAANCFPCLNYLPPPRPPGDGSIRWFHPTVLPPV